MGDNERKYAKRMGSFLDACVFQQSMGKTMSELEKLRAENARLREALEVFAALTEMKR